MELSLDHQHAWDLTPSQARKLQEQLRERVAIQPLGETIRRIGGVDASFGHNRIYAAAVVLDFPSLELVEQASAAAPITFSYVPGLLSFREAPGVLAALARLASLPDVLIVDGHGLAHPRRFGIAAHVGVLLNLPTIGCAKSVLVGEHALLSETQGSTAELVEAGEVIGLAVRTRAQVKPVYVSIGHRVDLPSAARLVLACGKGYRLPEPSRLAHKLATSQR